MYPKNRTCKEYLTRLKSFIIAAEAEKSNKRKFAICCPCVDCKNVVEFPSAMDVHAHLIIRGTWMTTNIGTSMERVGLMTETCRLVVWVTSIALKTSSLNNNITLVRMVMKDLLTLRDVKQTGRVRL